MRLIDADAINPMRCPRSISEMRKWIDDQPTAYDIEDIIKQLEKEKERQKENAIDRDYRFGVVDGMNVSIGIVKGGAE